MPLPSAPRNRTTRYHETSAWRPAFPIRPPLPVPVRFVASRSAPIWKRTLPDSIALAELSFEAPGRRTRGVHQQYALKRIVDGEEPSAAMFIEFDAKGVLIKSALAFTGEPCDTRAIARASAEKIRDFMISRMGPASVSFDRIGDWSKGPMKSVMPEVAFTAAWVSDYFDLRVAKASKASPRPADAVGPAPTAVQLASAYTEAINAFNGRLVTVNVSSANNLVVALVSVIPSA